MTYQSKVKHTFFILPSNDTSIPDSLSTKFPGAKSCYIDRIDEIKAEILKASKAPQVMMVVFHEQSGNRLIKSDEKKFKAFESAMGQYFKTNVAFVKLVSRSTPTPSPLTTQSREDMPLCPPSDKFWLRTLIQQTSPKDWIYVVNNDTSDIEKFESSVRTVISSFPNSLKWIVGAILGVALSILAIVVIVCLSLSYHFRRANKGNETITS